MNGKTVSHYEIGEKLGGGGMGVVYLARDATLDRPVAIKFLSESLAQDEETRVRFMREARSAATLNHANICTIHEIGETDDRQLYIVMAYYEGQTLKDVVAETELEPGTALDVCVEILGGLSAAHEKGLIHRDLKPANVIRTVDDEIRILDFGLAKATQGSTISLTKPGTMLGTTAYMAPEQVSGKPVDPRTDVWAVGVILHEMLSRSLPFSGAYDPAVLYAVVNDPPAPLPLEVPEAIRAIVLKALEKEPADRYQDVDEMLVAVLEARHTLDGEAGMVEPVPDVDPYLTLHRITMQMGSAVDVNEVLDLVANGLVEEFDAALARIWLVGPGDLCTQCALADRCSNRRRCLHLRVSRGIATELDGQHRRMPLGALKIGSIADSREPVQSVELLNDSRILDKEWVAKHELQSFAGYPLVFDWELLGVIAIFTRRRLDELEFERLGLFAGQTSLAIHSAELNAELQDTVRNLEIASAKLKEYNRTLERRVDERTKEVKQLNRDLQSALRRVSSGRRRASSGTKPTN